MTLGSNHTLPISQKGIKKNDRLLFRPRTSKKCCNNSALRSNNQRHPKAAWMPRTCLMFRFKDQTKMEQTEPLENSLADGTEGRLKELASKWFIETQVPLIVHNGLFPAWFLGFISRKDAEEILRGKELGCFLIRLSDKSIGYILSYKGRDRCRHFVINQSKSGEFIVCGDTEGHDSLSDLIEYYKINPIEPFGEYLTFSCFEGLDEDLYDVIQVTPKENPHITVRAARNVQQQQNNTTSERLPTRPPKSSRTLEVVPPLPRRGKPCESGPQNDQASVFYAQLKKNSPKAHHSCQGNFTGDYPRRVEKSTTWDQNISRFPDSDSESVYSELSMLDCKSRSLPFLDSSNEKQSYRLSASSLAPLKLSPKPLRQAASDGPLPQKTDLYSRPNSIHSEDCQGNNPVYHLAGRPGSQCTAPETGPFTSEQNSDRLYAEVSTEAITGHFPHDNTYEQIPGHEGSVRPKLTSNTYEPLEDIRSKHFLSSWGIKNEKWKRLFPEVKRK